MVHVAERSRQPGRNDPCPCGSGKKYKRCCLLIEVMPARAPCSADVLAEVHAADEAGDTDQALAILERSRSDVLDPQVRTLLVERYLDLSPERAEAALREWWEAEHDRFSGGGLARLLQTRGEKDQALEVLDESHGGDAWPEYWRLLAQLRDERGNTESAVAALEMYARLVPEDAGAWMTLADMQQRIGQLDRALGSLRRAGDTVPWQIGPRARRVHMLAEAARWQEVRDLAESLLVEQFDDSTEDTLRGLRDVLAQAYFVLGDFDAARQGWSSLLLEYPDDGEIRFRLAQLELQVGRYRRALLVLEPDGPWQDELRVLDVRLRAALALREFDEASQTAMRLQHLGADPGVMRLVHASRAADAGDHAWALEQLEGKPPADLRDLWHTLRLDCLSRQGQWAEISATLKSVVHPDQDVLIRAALGSMAAGKLDLAQRLLGELEDQSTPEARALNGLLGPLRQGKRAAEVRRQQQVDASDRQRWAAEARDLRRQIRDLEHHNAVLADSLARSEAAMERLLELVGVSGMSGMPDDWEAQLRAIGQRAHQDALQQELTAAEQRLRAQLGARCWDTLSESARVSLREGEWLFEAVQGEDRDSGAALLEYARGLERAYKDAIFVPVRARWEREPGPVGLFQTEGMDPSLGPFVRFVLDGGHLTLGSMAAALDRMADGRRRGVAIQLLREQVGLVVWDQHSLMDWSRTAARLATAAEARNQPAHAGAVSREAVQEFREMILGANGLLHALAP